jgi:hypothetical protein
MSRGLMIAHRRRNKRRDMAPTCDVDMPADAVMTRGIGDNKPPEPIFCQSLLWWTRQREVLGDRAIPDWHCAQRKDAHRLLS